MDAIISRLHKFDPHRLSLAPVLGLLAGFLANRAHDGPLGWAMLGEMVLGAVFVTFGATVLVNLAKLISERDRAAVLLARQRAVQAQSRRQSLIEAEAERYRIERFFREQIITATQRTERLERALLEQRAEANALRHALSGMKTSGASNEIGALAARLENLEKSNAAAEDAYARVIALEEAQSEMQRQQVELDRRAASEAEELKASLLQLAISESQRMRNMEAPENDQSGRIIELESRIHRLAREIEALSKRQPMVASAGQESLVKAGGTQDKARMGFLQAMLDANKTLRKKIKDAA
ncbi:MAG: hypothetical protein KDB82_12615 [Planctomycetes bacterium]|nr:hypothetical protein [Planctomycetota bacterium]